MPFNNISNPNLSREPLTDFTERTLQLMRGIVADYEADPKPHDILAFSTDHHAKSMLSKIEAENASPRK